MDRRTEVELFEEIRRGYASEETILRLAEKHGVLAREKEQDRDRDSAAAWGYV
jgi:hypothetical protein